MMPRSTLVLFTLRQQEFPIAVDKAISKEDPIYETGKL